MPEPIPLRLPLIRLTFEVEGITELSQTVIGISTRATNLTPFWSWVGEFVLFPSFVANFLAEGRPRAWVNLSPRYARWKEKHYPGQPILQLTGRLWRAVAFPMANPDSIFEVSARGVTVGVNARLPDFRYPVYHQSRQPRTGPLPRRPFIVLQPEDAELIRHGIVQYIREGTVPVSPDAGWAEVTPWE